MKRSEMRSVKTVRINEITPRDGLQNIEGFIPTSEKLKLVALLVESGARYIESTAFVSPQWVPQLADAEIVCRGVQEYGPVLQSALIPNLRGFDRALDCGLKEIVGVLSASEIHNKNNLNKSVDHSLDEMKKIGKLASQKGISARINIATAFGYRKDEIITTDRVLAIALALEESGYTGITLCDTTGIAHPDQVYGVCKSLKAGLRNANIAVHFHQNSGIELVNAYAAYSAGIDIYESAAGGLGGCPYADGTEGNIATEILVKMFSRMGVRSGIDEEKIGIAAAFAQKLQHEYSDKQAGACQ